MYTPHSTFIVIWDQQITKEFTDVLALGIRNIVIAPVTPQAVLEEVNKSLYQLSLVRQVSLQQELLQTMFDFQNDLLFIVEDDEIVDCNTNFLAFSDMKICLPIVSNIWYLLNILLEKMDTTRRRMI